MKEFINETNISDIRGTSKISRNQQSIIEALNNGQRDPWRMAEEPQTQPSYVASILQKNGLISGYYDLYTTPTTPLNIYSGEFRGKMGFKDPKSAKYSVHVLEEVYHKFDESHDRAGQHHCLVTALTMYNRARFSGKVEEAKIFKEWLLGKLTEALPPRLHS